MRTPASIVVSATLVLILAGHTVGSQGLAPIGVETQINTYTTGNQGRPTVALKPDGSFVVVWQSFGSDGTDISDYSIQKRLYDSSGQPVGFEGQVNSYTSGHQIGPVVGVFDAGHFVVVWQSNGSDGNDSDGYSIQGQRFNSEGQPVSPEFQVNAYTTSDQKRPAVALGAGGDFIVVWNSGGSAGSDSLGASVQGRHYDSNGFPVGGEFQVNTYTTGSQLSPAVGMNTDGDFVVAWTSYVYDGPYRHMDIRGRIYTSNGVPVAPDAAVNTYTTGFQSSPAVGVDGAGNFVVVWFSDGSDGGDDSFASVQGRLYSSSGFPVGAEIQVNTYTTGSQKIPDIGVSDDDGFVVVWVSYGSDGSDDSLSSIQGRLYTSDAAPVGGDFQINSYTTSYQYSPAVGVNDLGDFVVVWASRGSFGSEATTSLSVQGLRSALFLIFSDGFESGTTAQWDASVP